MLNRTVKVEAIGPGRSSCWPCPGSSAWWRRGSAQSCQGHRPEPGIGGHPVHGSAVVLSSGSFGRWSSAGGPAGGGRPYSARLRRSSMGHPVEWLPQDGPASDSAVSVVVVMSMPSRTRRTPNVSGGNCASTGRRHRDRETGALGPGDASNRGQLRRGPAPHLPWVRGVLSECVGLPSTVTHEFGSESQRMPATLPALPLGICLVGAHAPPPVPLDPTGCGPMFVPLRIVCRMGCWPRTGPCHAGDGVVLAGDLNAVPQSPVVASSRRGSGCAGRGRHLRGRLAFRRWMADIPSSTSITCWSGMPG